MALQTFARASRGICLPPPPTVQTSSISVLSVAATTIDAADEIWAVMIRAPKSGNIRSVWCRPAVVTTGATLTIGAYQVDLTTGNPATTPTPWATNTFVAKAIATTDAADVINSGAFTADAVVVKGDVLAICFINPSASFGNLAFSIIADENGTGYPYHNLYAGTWGTKQLAMACLALEYDDGSIALPLGCGLPGDAAANVQATPTLNNTTTPDLVGVRFQLPFPCRVTGVIAGLNPAATCNVKLVDATWNESPTGLLATAVIGGVGLKADVNFGAHWLDFETAVTLAANTTYRIVFEPTSASNISYNYIVYLNAAMMNAANLFGTNWALTTGKNVTGDGSWTNYNNSTDGFRVAWATSLIIDGLDDGVGGGGNLGIEVVGR